MKYYFAPMEGITGPIHRKAFDACFPGVDKYFTAFIAPNQKGKFSAREKKDIDPENNRGIFLVPQIMTNDAGDFTVTALQLEILGYKEVNLNLGCPEQLSQSTEDPDFWQYRTSWNDFWMTSLQTEIKRCRICVFP